MKSLSDIIHRVSRLVMPPNLVGGLQITNSSLRFMAFYGDKTKKTKTATLRLPPGIIENGRIQDRANFIAALKALRKQITGREKEIVNVVLTIPAGDVYVEAFKLPALEAKNIAQAADLNMKMISPNPIEKSYYSWMVVGEAETTGETEILGAFVLREVVDSMTSVLEEAGFGIAAVEFSSLSLKRILSSLGLIKKELPYLLIKITQEGIIFIIIRNENLYFNYFHPWEKVTGDGVINVDQVTSTIKSESNRVMNFYSSHYGGQIKNMIIITSIFHEDIVTALNSQYPDVEKVLLSSDKENLHGVRGAALRGLVSPLIDKDISLMSPGSLNAFWRDKINRFVILWRNLLLLAVSFMVVVFGAAYFFLDAQADAFNQANVLNLKDPETAELIALQEQARTFNAQVSALGSIRNRIQPINPLIAKINSMAAGLVTIQRLSLRQDTPAIIDGVANNQEAIINFKNRLATSAGFSEVALPLSSIVSQPSGGWAFFISFKVKSSF